MSRFRKLSHTIWHCQYHLVWTPKYCYRILSVRIKEEVTNCTGPTGTSKPLKYVVVGVVILLVESFCELTNGLLTIRHGHQVSYFVRAQGVNARVRTFEAVNVNGGAFEVNVINLK